MKIKWKLVSDIKKENKDPLDIILSDGKSIIIGEYYNGKTHSILDYDEEADFKWYIALEDIPLPK